MENQPKNYIPETVLEEADGDPRVAFGMMANQELSIFVPVGEENSLQVMNMEAEKSVNIPSYKDWFRMDDI